MQPTASNFPKLAAMSETGNPREVASMLIRREYRRMIEDRAGLTIMIDVLQKRGEQFPFQSDERSDLFGAMEHLKAFRDTQFP